MPMKFRVPEGCGSVGVGGVEYFPDADGCFEVADGVDVSDLFAHGVVDASAPQAEAEAEADVQDDEALRAALFAQAQEKGLKPHHKAGIAKLEAMLADAAEREAQAAQAPPAAE